MAPLPRTRRWLLSVANAGSQVARANAKLLQKKATDRSDGRGRFFSPIAERYPSIIYTYIYIHIHMCGF